MAIPTNKYDLMAYSVAQIMAEDLHEKHPDLYFEDIREQTDDYTKMIEDFLMTLDNYVDDAIEELLGG